MCRIVYLLFVLSFIDISLGISVKGIVESKYLNEGAAHVLTNNVKGTVRTEGIFERFIRTVLNVLTTSFPERKLTRFCRAVSRELDNMDYKYTKKLAKHFKYLSRMYREELKEDLREYLRALDNALPFRTEFFKAMNEIFTLRENQLFDDYVHDLKDYGNEYKLFINAETRKVLNNVIVDTIKKLSATEQRVLSNKMIRAVKEFKASGVANSFESDSSLSE